MRFLRLREPASKCSRLWQLKLFVPTDFRFGLVEPRKLRTIACMILCSPGFKPSRSRGASLVSALAILLLAAVARAESSDPGKKSEAVEALESVQVVGSRI